MQATDRKTDRQTGRQRKRKGEGDGERVTECVRSDDLDAIRLQGNMDWGWGCMEVNGSTAGGGRWSQLTGRDWRRGKDSLVIAMMLI